MGKVTEEEYNQALASDPDALAFIFTMSMGEQKIVEYFICDDPCQAIGEFTGTAINALSFMKKSNNIELIKTEEINQLRSQFRGIVRG